MTKRKEDAISSSGIDKKVLKFLDDVIKEKDLIVSALEDAFKSKVNKANLEGLNTKTIELFVSFEDYILDKKGNPVDYDEVDKKISFTVSRIRPKMKNIKICKILRPENVSMSWTSGNNKFSVAKDYYGIE